jgi:ABC-type glutathione transport system ATPase component
MTGSLLAVSDLRKVFRTRSARGEAEEFVAVDGISFELSRGGSLAIVGESGSGKTTTARIIAGLEAPTSGSVIFDGRALVAPRTLKERRERARRIQMVFQDPYASLDRRQTLDGALHEVLATHYREGRSWRTERILRLLDQVGLDAWHRGALPRDLSGGQRQRFAIAKALAVDPTLLILDESVSALDVSVQAQVLNLLIDLRARLGIAYLFVSHDLAVVRQIADTCLVMYQGQVVESGTTAAVLDAPVQDYTRQLLAAVPRIGWRPKRRTLPGAEA